MQPETGRRRSYCSLACRRLAERKLRVAEQLLARARREEQKARLKRATWEGTAYTKEARFWAAEVQRCEAELATLLAGSGEDEADEQ